ncbi:RNA polymerase sigma-70 factor (ECF subfamily) [Labedella gwakjiensis]|uniref:RNA polymerase sigma factor n=1 Tax=Labedella gwakjiensis TaxID=390269 RepID=A0A2P8GVV1_9MICO|nr:RNA polymerase sigma factor [Labedella gwakjiensis]PSL38075.1 RNA polymerase sigma-70 factor (ECF subfamily) [Labedella gwakjiensis]RUQ87367.1 RNA polymerase sigma factor [Labedella gwakjiensis]
MSPPTTDQDRASRFSALYDDAYLDVLRFVSRRSPPDVAEDVVHEAFLVAWRRFDDLPSTHDGARAWLFGVARHCLLNDRRTRDRFQRLGIAIAEASTTSDSGSDTTDLQLDIARAWRALSPDHQEVLSLATWEALPASEACRVLGISTTAYRVRLHRARTALRRHLDSPDPASGTPVEASRTEITA